MDRQLFCGQTKKYALGSDGRTPSGQREDLHSTINSSILEALRALLFSPGTVRLGAYLGTIFASPRRSLLLDWYVPKIWARNSESQLPWCSMSITTPVIISRRGSDHYTELQTIFDKKNGRAYNAVKGNDGYIKDLCSFPMWLLGKE